MPEQIGVDTEIESFRRGGQNPDKLKLSLDRKVSPIGWFHEGGNRWVPKVPNSFGLPSGVTCPGKTDFCNDCYAVTTENYEGVEELLYNNFILLIEAGDTKSMSDLLSEMVDMYEKEADRLSVSEKDKIFRIH